ncbi:MAG: hypothetical protein ABIT38_14525 [Gemmatimonadaceae bacterium]
MALSPHLRERILRQLDQLNDEKAYVVLDYVEYVATKYGTPPSATANIFARFTEGIEDTMRAGRLSTTAISQTMGLLNQAAGVLSGVAAAGKSVASDIVTTATDVAKAVTKTGTETPTDQSPATSSDATKPNDPALQPPSAQ